MSFDEVRFPTKISWGFGGGPEYNTDIIILTNGVEKRNSNWQNSRCKYEVAHEIKTQSELNELVSFFRARKGKARGFRFRDWNDYYIENEIIGTGNGVKTQYQITKTYTSSVSEVRNLTKIVSQSDADSIASSHGGTSKTWAVYVNNVLKTESTHYTVNRNTGIITFLSAPGNTHSVKVTCEFDVPVRFDTDRMIANMEAFNSYNWVSVPLIEVRV